jgi:predicted nucleotidyltransferase
MSYLPVEVQRHLDAFVASATAAFGADLSAVVLYGSAAGGKVRATSDINLLVLLRRFEPATADALREALLLAHAAIELQVMFLLESELDAATEAFAVKFADIIARHRVLHGADPFTNLHTAREPVLRRLRQELLNQQLRMRERYVLVSMREEQLVPAIADSAGPLRAAAGSLAQLEGRDVVDGKAALEQFVEELAQPALSEALQQLSSARETEQLPPGRALPTYVALMEIAAQLRAHLMNVK